MIVDYRVFRDEEDDGQLIKEIEISENRDEKQEEEVAKIAVHNDVVDGQPMLKSDKEKECWALFKKMTAKGVSVTFDTVLRFDRSLNYLKLALVTIIFR